MINHNYPIDYRGLLSHRIHGAIYGNMDPINIPQSCMGILLACMGYPYIVYRYIDPIHASYR